MENVYVEQRRQPKKKSRAVASKSGMKCQQAGGGRMTRLVLDKSLAKTQNVTGEKGQ